GPGDHGVGTAGDAGPVVEVGPVVEDLGRVLLVPAEDLSVVALALDLDDVLPLLVGLVDEDALVLDDDQVGGRRVPRGGHRPPGDPGQLVEAAVDGDVPVDQPVGAAGGPGDERLFDVGEG